MGSSFSTKKCDVFVSFRGEDTRYKCKDKKGQIAVPVFYRVDPSDVSKQKGSLAILRENFYWAGEHKHKERREALKKAANLSGWDSQTIRSEAKLVDELVKDIKHKLEGDFVVVVV